MVLPFLDTFLSFNHREDSFILAAMADGFEEPIWYEQRRIVWAKRGTAMDLAKNFAQWARRWSP